MPIIKTQISSCFIQNIKLKHIRLKSVVQLYDFVADVSLSPLAPAVVSLVTDRYQSYVRNLCFHNGNVYVFVLDSPDLRLIEYCDTKTFA